MKSRKKRLILNITFSFIYQIVTILCGFILPKQIILHYGSEVNGAISSINQYLGLIVIGECGIGAVTQSALYKPLADNDEKQISLVVASSKKFYRTLGCILIGYVALLCCVFPFFIKESFSPLFTITLLISIALTTFSQYYFSITYRNLVSANQSEYINTILQIITNILTTVIGVVMIKLNCSIQLVKLTASIIFLIQPIFLSIYVKKKFHLDKKIKIEEEPIKQKWNGVAQHIASVVRDKTDVVILTFYSLVTVSIYNVYYLVVNGIKSLVESFSSGITSLFGDMYARGEKEKLNNFFDSYEFCFHFATTFIFACVYLLMIPFVRVYTSNVSDANYVLPLFSLLFITAFFWLCIRIPYDSMIKSAGHYKQTQRSFIYEALINIVVSLVFFFIWGINGVALGTLCAMLYRTVYCIIYLKKNILHRDIKKFIKLIVSDIISLIICFLSLSYIKLNRLTYDSLILMGIIVAISSFFIILIVNLIINGKKIIELLKTLLKYKKQNGK